MPKMRSKSHSRESPQFKIKYAVVSNFCEVRDTGGHGKRSRKHNITKGLARSL